MTGPFIKIKNTTTRMMINVIVALIPIILFSFYKNGVIPYTKGYISIFEMFYPLIFILIGTLSTFIFETIYLVIVGKGKRKLKEVISNSYAFMPGLFLSLVLPFNTPIIILIFGAFVSSIIAKMLFGGFGQNIFNPALIGCLFVITAYSSLILINGGYMNLYERDTISGATPLSNVKSLDGIGSYETAVEPYGGISDFFIGTIPGSLGETSALLCIIAFIYLALTKTIKWRIPVLYISTVFIMSLFIGLYNGESLWYPLFMLFSGGLMFGAIFMATDPVTSPVTKPAQIVFGICLGILTVILRHLTTFPEGVLTSILTMNMFVVILDKFGVKAKLDNKKVIIPLVVLIILIFGFSFVIGNKYKYGNTETSGFKILNIETEGDNVIYTASQKGNDGPITLLITISNGNIVSAEVISQNESFFNIIEDADYINKLINSPSIYEVDTVSGATISSSALKKLFINVLDDYNGGHK